MGRDCIADVLTKETSVDVVDVEGNRDAYYWRTVAAFDATFFVLFSNAAFDAACQILDLTKGELEFTLIQF